MLSAELIAEFEFFVKQEVDVEETRVSVSVETWDHLPPPPPHLLLPLSLSMFISLSLSLPPSLSLCLSYSLFFLLSSPPQNLTEVMTTGLRQLVDNQERMFEQIK